MSLRSSSRKLSTFLPLLTALPALAQTRAYVGGTVGYSTFIDESDQSHVTAGGVARLYVSRRVAVEPEITYMYRSSFDKDLLLQGNISRDLGKATGKNVPFVTFGAGRLWTFNPRFTVSTWTAGGGGGVRIFVSDRIFIAPEARIGWEPILRLQVGFGWADRR